MAYLYHYLLCNGWFIKAIGAAQDAVRMERVVNFYARLPRGAAPEVKPSGPVERYQARYFSGKNASAARKSSLPRLTGWWSWYIWPGQPFSTLLLVSWSWVTAWSTTSTSVCLLLLNHNTTAKLTVWYQATTRTILTKVSDITWDDVYTTQPRSEKNLRFGMFQ